MNSREYPGNWRRVPFGEIVANSQYGLSIPKQDGGNMAILGMRHISGGKVSLIDVPMVTVPDEMIPKYLLKLGDFLFNRTNSADLVGKSAIFRGPGNFVFASYLVRFKLKRNALPEYVSHFFNMDSSVSVLRSLATPGVSQYNINPSRLMKKFCVVLPPLSDQERIVEVLSAWDSAIEKTEKLVLAKERRKKTLMHQLLRGKRRLGDFVRSASTKHTQFGYVPADWDYVHLYEIAREIFERNGCGDYPVLSCTKYDGLVSSIEYFGKQVFAGDRSNYKVVRRGHFAYATNHIEEGSIGYQNFIDAGLVSPIYTVFETDSSRVCDDFLYALFKTDLYRHIFATATNASVDRRGSLRWKDFAKIRVALPCLQEQKKIASVQAGIDKEIDLLKQQLAAFRRQKQGLMQQLLTGKMRLKTDSKEQRSHAQSARRQ